MKDDIEKIDHNPISKNDLGKSLSSKNSSKSDNSEFRTAAGAPVANNQDSMTAGVRGPLLIQDVWFRKMAHLTEKLYLKEECMPRVPHSAYSRLLTI